MTFEFQGLKRSFKVCHNPADIRTRTATHLKKSYFLYKGNEKQTLRYPPDWTRSGYTRFPETRTYNTRQATSSDARWLIRQAANAFPNWPKRNMTVAIIVDDPARATPVAQMLPPILHELLKAGISRKNITIVMALGTHRFVISRRSGSQNRKRCASGIWGGPT